jgi:hypothetical protein
MSSLPSCPPPFPPQLLGFLPEDAVPRHFYMHVRAA